MTGMAGMTGMRRGVVVCGIWGAPHMCIGVSSRHTQGYELGAFHYPPSVCQTGVVGYPTAGNFKSLESTLHLLHVN